MRENEVRKAVQNNFARVKHVSGKLNLSDILTKEDKDKAVYITLRYRLMSNLEIMSNVRRYIHICENVCVIPAYGDIFHHDYPPNHISNIDCTYNDLCSRVQGVCGETTGRLSINRSVCPPPLLGSQIDSTT